MLPQPAVAPAPVLAPEPAPLLVRIALANLVVVAAVWVGAAAAVRAVGGTEAESRSAAMAVVLGSMLSFIGSSGGSMRSGLMRALVLTLLALPLMVVAIAARPVPWAAGVTLAAMTLVAGRLAAHGEPAATLGSLVLYLYFLPLAFGAGEGVPMPHLLAAWLTATAIVVGVRAAMQALPQPPPRVHATDSTRHRPRPKGPLPPLLPEPQRGRVSRNATRSALALGAGAFVMSITREHNAVWVLMTIISVLPPQLPLTTDRVLRRIGGTAVAMVVLTAIDVLVPVGYRILAALPGLFLVVAYIRRSYFMTVAAVSTVAVLVYAGTTRDLGVALLARGVDTLIGAAIAVLLALLMPVTPRR